MSVYDGVEINPFKAEKKANHRAPIVRIGGTFPIVGADRIEGVVLEDEVYKEFSFVSQRGNFKPGDLAVFIQPDSIVPATKAFEFVFADYLAKISSTPLDLERRHAYDPASIPASQRRITVRRFKKQWSEGLLMPLSDFEPECRAAGLVCGSDMSSIIGIEHYVADEITGDERVQAAEYEFMPKGKKRYPKTFLGWFHFILHLIHVKRNEKFLRGPLVGLPVYDVENFKNYSNTFVEGEIVHVTEKIHGSSARFVAMEGTFYAGSRKMWINPAGDGYPAQAAKENYWIEDWCRRNEGYALYGEVTPRQVGYKYDDAANSNGVRFWLFDIRDPKGNWLDKDDVLYFTIPKTADMVPLLYHGPYHKDIIDKLVEGKTTTGGDHIREGVVIVTSKERTASRGRRAQLKLVSLTFLDKDKKLTSNV